MTRVQNYLIRQVRAIQPFVARHDQSSIDSQATELNKRGDFERASKLLKTAIQDGCTDISRGTIECTVVGLTRNEENANLEEASALLKVAVQRGYNTGENCISHATIETTVGRLFDKKKLKEASALLKIIIQNGYKDMNHKTIECIVIELAKDGENADLEEASALLKIAIQRGYSTDENRINRATVENLVFKLTKDEENPKLLQEGSELLKVAIQNGYIDISTKTIEVTASRLADKGNSEEAKSLLETAIENGYVGKNSIKPEVINYNATKLNILKKSKLSYQLLKTAIDFGYRDLSSKTIKYTIIELRDKSGPKNARKLFNLASDNGYILGACF